MRKSQAVKLVLIGGGVLAASWCVCGGCVGGPDETEAPARPAPDPADSDPQWYDEHGKPIPEEWAMDENDHFVPVGDPRDRYGRPLRFDEHGNRLLAAAAGAAAGSAAAHYGYRRSSSWFPFLWRSGGSSYGGSYRSPPSSGGSTYYGGSRPGTGTRPSTGGGSSTSRPSSGGSVSRGGFGGSGSSAAS